jgi:hypothetical protein
MKHHPAFECVRADKVAECWEGVGDTLYRALWRIVDVQEPIPNIEDNGPADVIGIGCVAKYWGMFSADEQKALNALAERHDAWLKEIMEG